MRDRSERAGFRAGVHAGQFGTDGAGRARTGGRRSEDERLGTSPTWRGRGLELGRCGRESARLNAQPSFGTDGWPPPGMEAEGGGVMAPGGMAAWRVQT